MSGKHGHLPRKDLKIMVTFQIWPKFSFGPWTIVHGGQKNRIGSKIYASIEVDVKCMQTILMGMAFCVLEILLLFKFGQIFLLDHEL